MSDFIYLASQSPRRRQLLDQIGVAHKLLLPAAHENAEALETILPNEAPADYVQRVTRSKSDAAWQRWRLQHYCGHRLGSGWLNLNNGFYKKTRM